VKDDNDCHDDYDSPWKNALEDYFAEFMAFFMKLTDYRNRWAELERINNPLV
jgi:hypothetical protein